MVQTAEFHNIASACQQREGEPIADTLAISGQIGIYTPEMMGTANVEAQPADHFVEDKDCTFFCTDIPQFLQKVIPGFVILHRFEDHRCNFARVLVEHPLYAFNVIVLKSE